MQRRRVSTLLTVAAGLAAFVVVIDPHLPLGLDSVEVEALRQEGNGRTTVFRVSPKRGDSFLINPSEAYLITTDISGRAILCVRVFRKLLSGKKVLRPVAGVDCQKD